MPVNLQNLINDGAAPEIIVEETILQLFTAPALYHLTKYYGALEPEQFFTYIDQKLVAGAKNLFYRVDSIDFVNVNTVKNIYKLEIPVEIILAAPNRGTVIEKTRTNYQDNWMIVTKLLQSFTFNGFSKSAFVNSFRHMMNYQNSDFTLINITIQSVHVKLDLQNNKIEYLK